jgi:hypothetical protein
MKERVSEEEVVQRERGCERERREKERGNKLCEALNTVTEFRSGNR